MPASRTSHAPAAPGDEIDAKPGSTRASVNLLENLYAFGHHGFVQTVPAAPSMWTTRPAAVVLISADQQPLEIELKDGSVMAGRVMAVASMVERRLLSLGQPLLSLHVTPLHGSFPAFRALNPRGVAALRPEPFLGLAEAFTGACEGASSLQDVERMFEQAVALVREQLPPVGAPDSRLAAVLGHLHDHPRASAAELGLVVGRSAEWVSRTFSSDMGLSLRDYMSWLKERVLLNILFTRRSITEVALDAGFSGASQFASAYQRWYGRTPSASRDPNKVRIFASHLPADQVVRAAFAVGLVSPADDALR